LEKDKELQLPPEKKQKVVFNRKEFRSEYSFEFTLSAESSS